MVVILKPECSRCKERRQRQGGSEQRPVPRGHSSIHHGPKPLPLSCLLSSTYRHPQGLQQPESLAAAPPSASVKTPLLPPCRRPEGKPHWPFRLALLLSLPLQSGFFPLTGLLPPLATAHFNPKLRLTTSCTSKHSGKITDGSVGCLVASYLLVVILS